MSYLSGTLHNLENDISQVHFPLAINHNSVGRPHVMDAWHREHSAKLKRKLPAD